MTTSTTASPQTPSTAQSALLRLALSTTPHAGTLAGAWWPRTRDLQVELADLVDHFPPEVGRVGRVLFSRPDWDLSPRKVSVARGILKTGSFPGDDTHVVVLTLGAGSRLRILVVPPETESEVAGRLMEAAVSPSNRRNGTELLARAAGMPGGRRGNDPS